MNTRSFAIVCALVLLSVVNRIDAQFVQAQWVAQSQQRIEKLRTTELRVIVLDAKNQPLAGIPVHVRQRRHAFPFGVHLRVSDEKSLQTLTEAHPVPVWGSFNAVAMDYSDVTRDDTEQPWQARLDKVLDLCEAAQLPVRMSNVIAGDPALLPNEFASLQGGQLSAGLQKRVTNLLTPFSRRLVQCDLINFGIEPVAVDRKLSLVGMRELFESAHAAAPDVRLGINYRNAITDGRLQPMSRKLTELREAAVPVHVVALSERVNALLVQAPIERGLTWLEDVDAAVVIDELEVGGPSPAASALNLEIMLRLLFASPKIEGIWFSGVTVDQVADPNAALTDDAGAATQAGEVLDNLIRNLWWTDVQTTSDPLGNVRLRVYAGWHDLTITLPDDTTLQMTVFVPMSTVERLVMVQPYSSVRGAVSP